MRFFLSFCLFTLSLGALSQNSRSSGNDYEKLFVKVEILPKFSGNLSNYIDSMLKNTELPNKGRVIIEVIIDSSGKSNYRKLYDHTDGDVSNLNLKELINRMPDWTPAFQNGHPVDFIFIILLDFSSGKLIQVREKNISEEMKYMLNSN